VTLMLVLLLLSAVPPVMELLVTLNCPCLWSTPVSKKRSCLLSRHLGPGNLPGIIPTKRASSSAANIRPRPVGASTSPGTVGHFPKTSGSQFQKDEEMDMLDGSNKGESNSDTHSNNLHTVGSDRIFVLSKSKKKKKIKHSLGGSSAPRLKAEYLGAHLSRYLCCLCSPCKCTFVSNY